jgi:hypothetical protein
MKQTLSMIKNTSVTALKLSISCSFPLNGIILSFITIAIYMCVYMYIYIYIERERERVMLIHKLY